MLSAPPTLPRSPDSDLPVWTTAEREDFFAAIARHRKAAWRVSAVCGLVSAIMAAVWWFMLSPLLFCVATLALDLVNIAFTTPDLFMVVGHLAEPFTAGNRDVQKVALALVLAFAPSVPFIIATLWTLERAFRTSPLFDLLPSVGRKPDPQVVSERRLENVVAEMTIAAGIPPLGVMIVEAGANAAAFGRDEEHGVVMVGSALLDSLTRDEMQGVAGHLVASVADGDTRIGLRVEVALGFFRLFSRVSDYPLQPRGLRAALSLMGALVIPSQSGLRRVRQEVECDIADEAATDAPPPSASAPTAGWRSMALLPFFGPVVMAGQVCSWLSMLLLTPAVALIWRQRKYMADANAVRLTRDPDGLARALNKIDHVLNFSSMPSWAAHLCVVHPRDRGKEMLGWAGSLAYPPLSKRHRSLERMGAAPSTRGRGGTWVFTAVKVAVVTLLAFGAVLMSVGVVMGFYVACALTMLFTLLPTAVVHALLRWIAR